jgi:hypothetical protein
VTEHKANPYQSPNSSVPGDQRKRNAPVANPNKNPWDNEPTWPGAEYDDDGAAADGMGDDDDDDAAASPWRPEILDFQQPSLWDEAVARIFACKSRSDSP